MTANVVRGLTVVGLYATFFIGALYMQHVLGYDTLRTGLAFVPSSLAVMSLSFGGTVRIMGFLGPKRTAVLGLLLALAGSSLFASSGQHTAYFPTLFVALVLAGLGGASLFTPLLTIAISGVPHRDAGLASGIVSVAQQVAAAFEVAVLGTIATSRTTTLLADGHSRVNALDGGYKLAFMAAALSVTAGLVVGLALLRSPKVSDYDPAHLLATETPEDLEPPGQRVTPGVERR
jgi:MFS family permease